MNTFFLINYVSLIIFPFPFSSVARAYRRLHRYPRFSASTRHAIARSIIDLALLDSRLTRSAHPADPLPSLGHLRSYITAARARANILLGARINPGATTNGD